MRARGVAEENDLLTLLDAVEDLDPL